MDAGASSDDVEAMKELLITEFEAGDVVGKLMAFINQLWQCGEDTRDYLKELCVSNNCPPLEIQLWVHTRWGSLSNCFSVILAQQKVCLFLKLLDESSCNLVGN